MEFTTELLGLCSSPTAVILFAVLACGVVVLWHILGYFLDPYNLRTYPGPILARLSNIWLVTLARQGNHCDVLTEAHKKYGELNI